MYDVIIVGAGSAGMTAAIYAGRKKLKTLLVTGPNIGGETNSTNDIQNYPGYEGPGPELMKKFWAQAKKWGAEILESRVASISKGKNFTIEFEDGKKLDSKTVILCYGRERRKLNIAGEDKFFGRGLSTCTTCDAPLFPNKETVVIGGGNSALEGALELARIAKKVYLVHRRDQFRADEVTVEIAKKEPKIEIITNHSPVEIQGDKFVKALIIEEVNTKNRRELSVQGIFSEIGWETHTDMVTGLIETNAVGEIVVDALTRTKTPGLYACGDLTSIPYKQTVISAGMGSIAALEAYKFVTGSLASHEYAK
ncbi:FAD-dependent oxidoreductase [Candidatus Woesearchaeota archaeon]|nr:FAD-dependent oxidoreductase [Candidatus Woesearchaeota archaeon]